jgi:hypothetical protein
MMNTLALCILPGIEMSVGDLISPRYADQHLL